MKKKLSGKKRERASEIREDIAVLHLRIKRARSMSEAMGYYRLIKILNEEREAM